MSTPRPLWNHPLIDSLNILEPSDVIILAHNVPGTPLVYTSTFSHMMTRVQATPTAFGSVTLVAGATDARVYNSTQIDNLLSTVPAPFTVLPVSRGGTGLSVYPNKSLLTSGTPSTIVPVSFSPSSVFITDSLNNGFFSPITTVVNNALRPATVTELGGVYLTRPESPATVYPAAHLDDLFNHSGISTSTGSQSDFKGSRATLGPPASVPPAYTGLALMGDFGLLLPNVSPGSYSTWGPLPAVPEGLVVYDSVNKKVSLYNGTAWVNLADTGGGLAAYDEGIFLSSVNSIDFRGIGVTASINPVTGILDVDIDGGSLDIAVAGSSLGTTTQLNFTGPGVFLNKDPVTGVISVDISSGSLTIQDEGTSMPAPATIVNFSGDSVNVTQDPVTLVTTVEIDNRVFFRDNGAPVGEFSIINLLGSGFSVVPDASGTVLELTINSRLDVNKDSTFVLTTTELNFTGAGVTVTPNLSTGAVDIDIPISSSLVNVSKDSTLVSSTLELNFTGVGVTVTDNPSTGAVDIDIIAPPSLLDVSKDGTLVSSTSELNFIGAGVTVTDNPSTGAVDIDIPLSIPGIDVQFDSTPISTTDTINFTGDGVTVTSDPVTGDVEVNIPTPTSSVLTIKDEGVLLPLVSAVNFIGAGVTCAFNAVSNEADVTIPSGGALFSLFDGSVYNPISLAPPAELRLNGNLTATESSPGVIDLDIRSPLKSALVSVSGLGSGASTTINLTLTNSCNIYKVVCPGPFHIRAYSSSTFRSLDASRPVGDPPNVGTIQGLVFELDMTSVSTWELTPIATFTSADTSIYLTVFNPSGAAASSSIQIDYLALR